MNLSRLSPLAVSVLTLWGSLAAAEGIKHPFCGTYPGIDLAHLLNAREARERAGLAVRGANVRASSVVSRNGDVAMLIDQGDLLFKANGLDLQGKALEFAPGYTVSRVDRPLNPEGAPIALGDDDSREVPLPFAFPFFGKNYDKAFVNSDGNLTFEAADNASTARTLARLVAGPPRIAPLLADLDPSKAGRVTTSSSAASFTVRWTDVPQFDLADKNTFDLTLFPDGRISFSYDAGLTLGLSEGAVGISAGGGGEGLTTTNLSDVAGLSFSRSVGESFRSESGIDLSAVARAFYTQFGDDYQQMIVYTNRGFIPPSQGAFAYESTVRNNISGIGGSLFDNGAEYGSPRTLESVVMMDRINKYSTNATDRVLREETTLSVLAHEVGHRWLATAKFSDGGVASNELLGRQQAHWSFYMHSSGSHDEGNQIDELGAGVFRTGPTSQRYGPLDQYLMGVRTAEEVPPFFFIRSPIADGAQTAERAPESNVDIKGIKKDVTIADVIAAMGPRSPAAAPNGAPWRVAFLYVTEGEAGDAAALATIDRIRSQFEEFFQRSTEGRLSVDTRLK
ncbi:MAG: hypothetical protein KA385_07500 [Vicinamibacteria bacterium]|jgi:hypothetical protein|nr:hypothetical protein [Vicinamibacteria bacterium]